MSARLHKPARLPELQQASTAWAAGWYAGLPVGLVLGMALAVLLGWLQ